MSHRTLFLIAAIIAGGILIGALAAPFVSPVPKDGPGMSRESTASPRIQTEPATAIQMEPEPDFMLSLPDDFDPLADNNSPIWQYPQSSYEPWEPEDSLSPSEIAPVPAEEADNLPERQDSAIEQIRKSDLTRNGLY